jgi:hypothetical protein
MFESFQLTPIEILVIVLAFVIVFALLRVFRKDTMADRKRQEIEMKRAALIAKRKAQAQEAAKGDAAAGSNTQD